MSRLATLLLAAGVLAASAAHAGPSATASASVFIFKPLTITATAQMSFGKLQYNAASGPAVATVVLSSQPPVARTSADVQLLPNGGETPAIRNLTGEPSRVYRVTVSNTTSTPGGLVVNTYTVWSTNSGDISATHLGTLSAAGTDTIRIGATLNVPQKTKNDTFTALPTILISYE
ncbi:MAG: DUF4402 domain-containing protein [Caulobacterales bacterium]|jgi:hypothetical protein